MSQFQFYSIYSMQEVLFTISHFTLTGSIPVLQSALGSPPNTSILLDNVVCSGGERDLLECDYIIGTISCDRSHEAGVRCEGRQT